MGERGARRDPSTPDDNQAMAALAGDAVRAGALGFSTSRTLNHRTSTGDYTPTLKAGEDELTAIAGAMHKVGRSVFQFVLDLSTLDEDLPMMLRVAENTRIPVTFSITQNDRAPRRWRQTLDTIAEASARGLSITAQIAARPVGLLLGLELSRNPFQTHPSYRAIAHLPLAERLKRLHQPEVRAAILSEAPTSTDDPLFFRPNYDKMFLLGDPPDYEQPPENALGAQAAPPGPQAGRTRLRGDAVGRRPRHALCAVPQLRRRQPRCDAGNAERSECGAGPVRRRRALRHHLRRQFSDLSADALDPRPHAAAKSSRSRSWWRRSRARPRCRSASPTAA